MPKPAVVPHWADTPTTLRTTPPAGIQNTGYAVLTKLPAQYFNWLIGLICDWWVWVTSYVSFDAGAVAVTGRVTATSYITAGSFMKPTDAADVIVEGNADGFHVHTLASGDAPVRCGVDVSNFHALTPAAMYGVSAVVTGLVVGNDSEQDLAFGSAEYLAESHMWEIAHPNRLVAPRAGYYHVDLYAEFAAGAAINYRQYITLHHSADSRVLTRASTANDSTGAYTLKTNNALCCSIACYLTAGQYVYARIYQKDGVGNLNADARGTMHRVG